MFPRRVVRPRCIVLGGPQHGHVVGNRDHAQCEEEHEQPGGEDHHLDGLETTITATTLICSPTDSGVRAGRCRWPVRCRRRAAPPDPAAGRSSRSAWYLVADGGNHERDRHQCQETDCLPEPLAGHPGAQPPQLTGEVHHHGQHQQRQRPGFISVPSAPELQLQANGNAHNTNRSDSQTGQPDRQQGNGFRIRPPGWA